MYDLSNGPDHEAAKRAPALVRGLRLVLVPVEFALRSRLRWPGAAVAIRCPFSRPVPVCFGNDPSAPDETPRTGKANRLAAAVSRCVALFFASGTLRNRGIVLARDRTRERVVSRTRTSSDENHLAMLGEE